MSYSKLYRDQLCSELSSGGFEMAPCTACRTAPSKPGEEKAKCIVGLRSKRCSECVRKGYTYCDVTLTAPQWMQLRRSRDRLRKAIEEIEEEEIGLL